jgi:hypothetical protein
VQSEFNFLFWFVSYNIFLARWNSGARRVIPSHAAQRTLPFSQTAHAHSNRAHAKDIAYTRYNARNTGPALVPGDIQDHGAAYSSTICSSISAVSFYGMIYRLPVQTVLGKESYMQVPSWTRVADAPLHVILR